MLLPPNNAVLDRLDEIDLKPYFVPYGVSNILGTVA
jgi:hypothetical protein